MTGSGVRSARGGACPLFLFLFVCASPAAGERQTAEEQPGGDARQPDVLLRAMQDELSRSTATLQLEELERPYFIEYAVVDTESNGARGDVWRERARRQVAPAVAARRRSCRQPRARQQRVRRHAVVVLDDELSPESRAGRRLRRPAPRPLAGHRCRLQGGAGAACAETGLPPEPRAGGTDAGLLRRGGRHADRASGRVRVRRSDLARRRCGGCPACSGSTRRSTSRA